MRRFLLPFAAFTAVFAGLAAFVFWGTWSLDAAPVMPDCPVWHLLDWGEELSNWWHGWLASGCFIPGDLQGFVGTPWFRQELQYAFASWCAALALAYYLRGRGLPRVACYGAGLLLAFSGYWFSLFSAGHYGWFVWMTYGPFAFGLIDRALRGGAVRHWLLLGAVMAWGSFHQPDMWLLFAVFAFAYFVFKSVRAFRGAAGSDALRCVRNRWLVGSLMAAAAFALIGLPSFRNAFGSSLASREKQIEESKGGALAGGAQDDAEVRWIFATNWSMPPEDTLEFFIPRIHGDTSCPMTLQLGRRDGRDVKPYTGRLGRPLNADRGNYRQHSLYVGWITCLLALFGVVCGIRRKSENRPEILFFAVCAFLFWLFSMGRFCEPVYRLVYMLPFGDALRAPVKWHHLTEFSLALLAGYGLAFLHARLSSRFEKSKNRESEKSKISIPTLVAAAVAFVGACDLARIDRLYCAPIDLSLVRGPNAVADEVLKRGKGTVVDLVEGGRGLVSWSFGAHGVPLSGDPNDANAKYALVPLASVKADKRLGAFLAAKKAQPVGSYLLTQKGIRGAGGPQGANVALYAFPDGPLAPPPVRPPVQPLVLSLGILSLLATLGVAGYALFTIRFHEEE